jgi:hypothetical protein
LAHLAQLAPGKVLIPEPETAEAPDDLFPGSILGAPKALKAGKETKRPPKDDELFPEEGKKEEKPEEEDIPQVDENLLRGWRIVKDTVKELKVTDNQIKKWFGHYKITMGLSDFDKPVPPPEITNEILSNFQTMLDVYREKQKEAPWEN